MSRFLLVSLLAASFSSGCGEGREPQSTNSRHVVEIRNFEYIPSTLMVSPGDTIEWTNKDMVPHTVTFADGGRDSGSIPAGGSWSATVVEGTTGSYICTFHPTMTGQVVVELNR